ncbi:GGDEF domain-containing protein [Klebsiella pneumoniae]|uniref:GGDEF domain-containing protein n=1 Tax=Klebsiella pneumoniae TaxID=573 RepID=UPI0019194BB9|nr:hypothetical protein [Klebsiella pneumoniae]CAA0216517.1 Uncharacterised protein [Klebsiella pneumoniae]
MSSLSIRSFTLFREEQPVRDALVLFTLTLLLHFLGAMLRLVQELSFFWPLNAVMAGIFARYVWLNRSYFYAVCFAAMLVYDGLTSRWGMGFASLLINFSKFAVAAVVDSAQQGYLLAEKIRHGVESQPFGLGQNPIHLTISLGLETREVGHARITELFNQLLLAADDEMVKAKQSGRNQICMPTLTESAP